MLEKAEGGKLPEHSLANDRGMQKKKKKGITMGLKENKQENKCGMLHYLPRRMTRERDKQIPSDEQELTQAKLLTSMTSIMLCWLQKGNQSD